MLSSAARMCGRLWLTGGIYLLAGLGYVFYGILWMVRLVQRAGIAALGVVLVLVLALAAAAGYCAIGNPSNEQVVLVVEPGQSLHSVARRLAQENVVCSPRALVAWMQLSGQDKLVQAGRHEFVRGAGLLRASRQLQDAIPVERLVTIREGLTVEQCAAQVQTVFDVDSAAFVALCTDTAFIRTLGIEAGTLEGYLFPETYQFPPEVTARQVVARMVDQFHAQYERIEIDSGAPARLTRHELVTLASIVEKEATLASERSRIAGVFHNRLRIGYPLGADPTVRYALRKFSGPLRVSELNSSSPYNTRVHKGLPPGPICSPGFGALQAAASPMDTKDLYFVAKWDGSGEHDFSRTLAEHERKKHEARRRNRERIRAAQTKGTS